MCGISAIISRNKSFDLPNSLMASIRAMEYRGYDSAGACFFSEHSKSASTEQKEYIDGSDRSCYTRQLIGTVNNEENYLFELYRSIGKTSELESFYNGVNKSVVNDYISGMAHTRWATHGRPSIANTHPITFDDVIIVHNGVVENYSSFYEQISGSELKSDTDTEVLAAVIQTKLNKKSFDYDKNLSEEAKLESIFETISELEGKCSFILAFKDNPRELFGVCKGLSLLFAKNTDGFFLTSDASTLENNDYEVIALETGDIIKVNPDGYHFIRRSGKISFSHLSQKSCGKKTTHKHHMYSEILEQPKILSNVVHDYKVNSPKVNWDKYNALHIVACGSSHHAAIYAKYLIESMSNIRVLTDISSEFAFRSPFLSQDTLYIFISQSGETADTLAALELVNKNNCDSLAIVNAKFSAIQRKAKNTIIMNAGKETSVASTKSFTAQLLLMHLIAMDINKENYNAQYIAERLSSSALATIKLEEKIIELSRQIKDSSSLIFTGKGISYVSALEACLKMQELSYIHTLSFPSGEFKHGPLALIDQNSSIIFIATQTDTSSIDKISSYLSTMKTRGAKIFLIGSKKAIKSLGTKCEMYIEAPDITDLNMSEIIAAIPLQLLAYHTSLALGNNVDRPRNLAKSVTVE